MVLAAVAGAGNRTAMRPDSSAELGMTEAVAFSPPVDDALRKPQEAGWGQGR